MREYRGKTTSKELPIREFNNIWVEGDLIKNGNKFFIHPHGNVFRTENELAKLMVCHEVIPETVGQFTGLTDKNGKKVFEGDILVFCKGATYPYQIEWDGMGWKLYRSDGKRIKEAFECNEIHYVNISEIIGNIHDNPELLGE